MGPTEVPTRGRDYERYQPYGFARRGGVPRRLDGGLSPARSKPSSGRSRDARSAQNDNFNEKMRLLASIHHWTAVPCFTVNWLGL